MIDALVLPAYAHYHQYANRLLLETAAQLSDAQFYFESEYSHRSVYAMLRHMLGTQRGFLACLRGEPSPATENLGRVDLCEWLEQTDAAYITYLAAQTPGELERMVVLEMRGQRLELPAWQLVMQVFVHATHHRGELSIMLTGLGYPLPTLDIIIPFVEESGQVWP